MVPYFLILLYIMEDDERDNERMRIEPNPEKISIEQLKYFIRNGMTINGRNYGVGLNEDQIDQIANEHSRIYNLNGGSKRKTKRKSKRTKKWTKIVYKRICKIHKKTNCKCFKNGKKMKCSKYKWPNENNMWANLLNIRKF